MPQKNGYQTAAGIVFLLLVVFLIGGGVYYLIRENYKMEVGNGGGRPEEAGKTCQDLCGDGKCDEIVCMAVGCPCAESPDSCPADCHAGLANPASVYCTEKMGGQIAMRQDADGGQSGYCLMPDGNECEEWALYGGECQGYPGFEEAAE